MLTVRLNSSLATNATRARQVFSVTLCALLLWPFLLSAQPTQQSGRVTPGHIAQWATNGVLQDGGPANNGTITSLGLVGTGLPACINDVPIGSPGGYHQLCLGALALGGGLLSYNAYGGASPLAFLCSVNGTTVPCFGTVTGLAVAANLAAVKALPVNTYATVYRAGYAAAGDGGGAYYNYSSSACSLNSGAGDNGSQIEPNTGGGCWLASFGPGGADVRVWGADGTGSNDSTSAFAAALAATGAVYVAPGTTYRSSSGIVENPGNVIFSNSAAIASGIPGNAPVIRCDLSVAVCVKQSCPSTGATNVGGAAIKGVVVTRAAGTIPSGSIGVLDLNCYGNTWEDVLSQGHAIGFEAQASDTSNLYGIVLNATRIYTGNISDAHLVSNGFPEIRVSQYRFGGSGVDQAANAYVRWTGGSTGPNTMVLDNGTMAQSQGLVGAMFQISNSGSGQGSLANIEFTLANSHVETMQSIIKTDGTVTTLNKVTLANNSILDDYGIYPFFALSSATAINDLILQGNNIAIHDVTLNNTQQFNGVEMVANIFDTPIVDIVGVGNSTIDMTGNTYNNGVTLAGAFEKATLSGVLAGGVISNTAAGPVQISVPNGPSWTPTAAPTISFGGGSTGVTYNAGLSNAAWQLNGSVVTYTFSVTLTSKGSSTGAVLLNGLPFTVNGNYNSGSGTAFQTANFTGLVSPVLLGAVHSTTAIGLYEQSSTGTGQLTDANFTNTSVISGTIQYLM